MSLVYSVSPGGEFVTTMNVRSLTSTAPAQIESSVPRGERNPPRERAHLRKVTDSLILSDRARIELNEMRRRPELERRIRTRMHVGPLSGRRIDEVAGRIEQGYYRDPHVLYRIASNVGGALTYGL